MRPSGGSHLIMRTTRTVLVVIVAALAVAACAQAAPGWTYAPPPPSPSAGPSTAISASPAASGAAPSAPGSAAPASATPSGAPASAGTSAAPASAAPSSGGGTGTTIKLLASGIQFDQTALSAPANAPFQIAFTNNDASIMHNVAITSSAGSQVFVGDFVTGVASVTYSVPALPAGTYTFVCQVHPSMTGTLTVQ